MSLVRSPMSRPWLSVLVLAFVSACSDAPKASDAGTPRIEDAAMSRDAGPMDVGASPDSGAEEVPPDAGETIDAGETADAGEAMDAADIPDATEPSDAGGRAFSCGAFTEDPGWTVLPEFRAVVVADATDGLSQPVALRFAGGAFGDRLYVVNQGNSALLSINTDTGATRVLVAPGRWGMAAPRLLTSITWDSENVFDGLLYVGDQGSDGDGDSRVYRVGPSGTSSIALAGPGPGLDDVYALAFAPAGSRYPSGLYVSGDTDGAGPDWGRYDQNGIGVAFSDVGGIEGVAFDRLGIGFSGAMYVARPAGGGYAGDGSITAIQADGAAGKPVATGLGGVHANVFSPGGAFGVDMYAASWSSGELLRIRSDGSVVVLALGLVLTNYDGNILDFSPDGNALFIADRSANRVVCIERN